MTGNDLQEALKLSQEKLDLIDAIDRIRDTSPEPSAMMSSIINLLADRFGAALCLIALIHRDTGDLELKAINDRGELLRQLGSENLRALARQAIKSDDVVIWKGADVLPDLGVEPSPDIDRMELVAVPIIMGTKIRLGVLLLIRLDTPFSRRDIELLETAESHIDSAMIQGYVYYDLQQRNKELETIYRIDRIRDRILSFDEMLNTVLQELRSAIQAEMGFIMLYNHAGARLELRAVTHDDLFRLSSYHEIGEQVANEALEKARLVHYNNLEGDVRSVMCIPLILRDEILGVFGVVNRYGSSGFDEYDRSLLNAIASQMDTAIFESLEQRRLRQVLGRSVDPRVMDRLMENPDVGLLAGERTVLTVLYADLRGSTELAEQAEPEMLVRFVNDYLGRMAEVVLKHEGTLDKFIGDEVMALFGAPFPQPDHALRAVRVGLEMQTTQHQVIEEWSKQGIQAVPIGIGIATGELIVGEMGSAQRTDYTVIGRAANLGARICGAAGAGQVLVSQETYDLVGDQVEATPVTGLQLKGIKGTTTVHHVTRILE